MEHRRKIISFTKDGNRIVCQLTSLLVANARGTITLFLSKKIPCILNPTKVVPTDRNGEYEPQIVPKHQREWSGFDGKILSMYGLGLSTKAIQEHLKDIYKSRYHLDL